MDLPVDNLRPALLLQSFHRQVNMTTPVHPSRKRLFFVHGQALLLIDSIRTNASPVRHQMTKLF